MDGNAEGVQLLSNSRRIYPVDSISGERIETPPWLLTIHAIFDIDLQNNSQ